MREGEKSYFTVSLEGTTDIPPPPNSPGPFVQSLEEKRLKDTFSDPYPLLQYPTTCRTLLCTFAYFQEGTSK